MIIRTIVAYANRSRISSLTRASLEKLNSCSEIRFEIVLAQGSNIVRNRNAAINAERSFAVHQRMDAFDYLLCIDSDVAFDVRHVRRLLSHDLDIVGGSYQKRERPDLICAGYWHDQVPGLSSEHYCPKWNEEGLKRVDWLGGGFLLVKKKVLEIMEYPWFRYEIIGFQKDGIASQTITSDDFGFAINATRAGYPLWLDCSCKLEHMAVKTAGILADLSAAEKIAIIENELDGLEKEIYRNALQLQSVKRGQTEMNDTIRKRIEDLYDRKFGYLQELERIQGMVVAR